jgi:hypothetical protein
MRKTKLFRAMLPALAIAIHTTLTGNVQAVENAPVSVYEGSGTNARKINATTNTASGVYSTASGYKTEASGQFSTAMGDRTEASNLASTASGSQTTASGKYSTASGVRTIASGDYSTTSGIITYASGETSTASGRYTNADCFAQTTIGQYSDNSSWTSCNPTSYAQDNSPLFVIGNGLGNLARSNAFVVYDDGSAVFQGSVYADDGSTLLNGYDNTTSNGFYSNSTNAASGSYSTAMGKNTSASGQYSTAFGKNSIANGLRSVAIGDSSTASGSRSTALGADTTASGQSATAMGLNTTAQGGYSTAMGQDTLASGEVSTATGYITTASGNYSTATGIKTTASGYRSTSSGYETTADCTSQTTIGNWSDNSSWTNCNQAWSASNNGSPLFVIGNGTASNARSNAFVVYDNGTANLSGNLMVGGDVTVSSDARLKQNIVPLAGSLDKVQQLRGVSYEWMDPNRQGGRHIGFIAQEVQEIIPEVVRQNGDYMSMSYANLTAVLVEAVKEQQTEIDQLEEENNTLEAENASLRGRLESIEAVLRQAGLLK